MLDAVTASESARWAAGDEWGRQQVEPLTNYFLARAFRDTDRAGYGGLFTAVNRDLAEPLGGQLVRTAYVGGVDGYVFLDPRKDWVVAGRVAGSWVNGSQEAVEGLQLGVAAGLGDLRSLGAAARGQHQPRVQRPGAGSRHPLRLARHRRLPGQGDLPSRRLTAAAAPRPRSARAVAFAPGRYSAGSFSKSVGSTHPAFRDSPRMKRS